jgi:hypothetical protein
MVLDKKLLVDGKSIRQEKDRGKEKSRAEGKEDLILIGCYSPLLAS